jgi:hypothetical protein
LGKSYLNGWIDEKSSLSKESQVFNPSQFMHFKQKAMGEGLKTANLGRCRIIQVNISIALINTYPSN